MSRVVQSIALLLVLACKKEAATPPSTPPQPAEVEPARDAEAEPVAADAGELADAAGPDDAGVPDAGRLSKGTSPCAPTECYMPAEKACYVPDPGQGICGNVGAVCRRCKPR